MKQSKQTNFTFGVAALSVVLNANGELQLLPAGKFRGNDGRPKDADFWVMDAQAANAVIDFCSSYQTPFVLDYEHQTLLKDKNGQPAPAAGWFGGADLIWREGEGLFAKADLTERAKAYIESNEYKFVSPVIYYEKGTGRIVGLHSAALTNKPNIDGMDSVSVAINSFFNQPHDMEALTMNELLEQLRWLLNLPVTATAEDVVAELQKAIEQIRAVQPVAAAANGFSIASLVSGLGDQVAALTNKEPDPAKYVPIATFEDVKSQLTALTADVHGKQVDGLVAAALTDGRLLPAQEKWARDLGAKDMAALSEYLDTSKPVPALTGTQTGGDAPGGDSKLNLSDPSAISEAALAYQNEQAGKGISINSAQAVAHVTKGA